MDAQLTSSSVNSTNRVRLPLLTNPSPMSPTMKSNGAEFLRPDALPGVNNMRGYYLQV